MITIRDIRKAADTIRAFIHRTPLIYSNSFSTMTGADVYLKAENLQKTGSFKVRGAFSKMAGLKNRRVVAASMGNHAQGVAYAAAKLGIEAKIVMPETAPIVKQEATRGYGAEVVLHGERFSDALLYARSEEDYEFIHAYDDDEVIAGQGTVGEEIGEDLPGVAAVLVPVGGGGLISGVAVALKSRYPECEIVGVQSESAPAAHLSFRKGGMVEATPLPTIADGIAVHRIGERAFEIMRNYVDDVVLVSEESIAMAVLLFLERKKLVVEGAGAVTLAALMQYRERFAGKRCVLVVSGGNIDFTLIDKIIHKGLVSSGRIGVFEVVVEDVPGMLHNLTGIVASSRANILNVVHDRLSGDLPVGKTRVIFTVEVRGRDHQKQMTDILVSRGFEVHDRGC